MCQRQLSGIQMILRSAGLFSLLAIASSASGQVYSSAPVAEDSGVAIMEQESFSGSASLGGTYFDIRHQTNSGVGYQNGFTQFGIFSPFWGSPDWFVAPNARFILTDNSATGFNAGLVARRYHEDWDRIFGGYAYYDQDQSVNKNRYDQVSFGLESLGKFLDIRANGYIPTDPNSNFVRATSLSPNLVFFGNRLGFIGTQIVEQPLAGGDAEVGIPFSPQTPWLRGYAGAYAYDERNGKIPVGVRGRVEGWISNDLSLQAMITSDRLFGTNVNFIIDWRFAGWQPTRYFPNWTTRERMLMPVQRNWRIAAAELQERVDVAADNPRDGEKYFVVWVDPNRTSPNPGTGTYEDPYHSMPTNVPNETDLLMVLRGDTTAATPLAGTTTLPDFARMLGEGHAHIADVSATFGPFTQFVDDALLPDDRFRNTGLYPFLTNPAGNIVNVGNHNEVAAFVMENSLGGAIVGQHPNGFNFHHLEITGNQGGIVLTSAQGVGPVTEDGQVILGGRIADINRNLVPGWLNPLGLGNNGGPAGLGGIYVQTGPGGSAPLELSLERISMNAAPLGQSYGIRLLTDQAGLVANLQDISTSGGNAVAGVSIEQFVGGIDAFIGTQDPLLPSLTSNNNAGVGLQLISGFGNPMNVFGTNIAANGNVLDNLRIAGAGNANVLVDLSASSFDGSVTGPGISLDMVAGVKTLSLSGVSASVNLQNGVHLRANGGTLNFNASDLVANNNFGTNLLIELNNATFNGQVNSDPADLIFSSFDNSVTGAGIALSSINSTSSLALSEVSASGNLLGRGVDLLALGGTLNFAANDLVASGNFGTNLNINLTGTTFQGSVNSDPANLTSSRFDDSVTGSGIALTATGGTARFDLDQILARDNFADGLQITALGGAQIGNSANLVFDGVNVIDSTLTGNGGMGISQFVAGGSHLEVFVDPTDLSGNGLHGSRFEVLGNSTFVGLYDQTNFDNSGSNPLALELLPIGGRGRGLFGHVDGAGSQATVAVLNSTINSAAADGVSLNVTNGGLANLSIFDTPIHDSAANGVFFSAINGSTANVRLTNVSVRDSGQVLPLSSGVQVNAADGFLGGSTVNLTLAGTTALDNSLPGGPAAFGLSTSSAGIGTTVNVNADGTTFNNAASNAVQALVLTGSTTNFEFTDTGAFSAGGDGLNAFVGPGSIFNACLETARFDASQGAGVRITNTGAGAVSNVHFEDSTANNNLQGGLVAQSLLGGELNFRSVGSNFSENGTVGLLDFDGVHVNATGAGSIARLLFNTSSADANSRNGFNFESAFGGYLTARIDSISAQSNGNYGVRLDVNGLPGDQTFGIVIPEGVNTVLNNGVGSYQYNFNGGSLAAVALTGSFNNQATDGVSVNIANVDTAAVSVIGDGNDTINDNLGDGINISITNAQEAGVFVAGYSSISNNRGDAIEITLDNITTAGAVQILGPTNMVNNDDNGVLITLTDVELGTVSPLIAGLNPLSVLTLTDNAIFNACLPTPVDEDFSFLAIAPTSNGIEVDGLTLVHVPQGVAGQDGIAVIGNHVTGTGEVILSNNTVSNYNNGILATFGAAGGASSFGGVTVSNADVNGSTVSGINLGVNGGSVPITISDSVVAVSNGNGVNVDLTNVIGGQDITVSNLSVSNSGGRGVSIAGTGDVGDVSLTNVSASNSTGGDGIAFVLTGGTVGNVTVDGQGTALVQNSAGNGILVDLTNSTVNGNILLTENTVDVSSAHGISLALDGVLGGPDVTTSNSTVSNSGGIGISLTAVGATLGNVVLDPLVITNSGLDGMHLNFTNAQIDSLLVDDVTITNSGSYGLRSIFNGTTGTPDITFNLVSSTVAGGRGVSLAGLGDATNPFDLGDITLTNVTTVSSLAGEGVAVDFAANTVTNGSVGAVRLNNVSTYNSGLDGTRVGLARMSVGSPVSLDGQGTAQSLNNGGDGIEVNLVGITGAPDVSIINYNLVDNNGGRGIVLLSNGSTLGDVTVSDQTVSNSNGGQGELIDLTNSVVGSVTMNNNFISNSAGTGLQMILDGVTGLPDVSITNATTTTSGGGGVSVTGVGTGVRPLALGDVTLTDVTATDSAGGDGVRVDFSANAVANGTVGSVQLNNVSAFNSALDGIHVGLNTMAVGPLVAVDGRVAGLATAQSNNSGGDGIEVNLNAITGAPDVTVFGYASVDTSGGRGIAVLTNGSTVGDVTVSKHTVSNSNGGQGELVDLTGSLVGSLTMEDNIISDSFGRGLDVVLNSTTGSPDITISNATVTNSGGRGVSVAGNLATLGDITMTNVSSDTTTTEEGVAVVLSNGTVGAIGLNNVSANLSDATGILVDLLAETMTGLNPAIALDGQGTAFSTNNGGDGILVDLNAVTGTPDVSVSNYSLVDNNAGRGIVILSNGSAVGDVTMSDNTVSNSLGGQGELVDLTGSSVGSVTMNNNTISDSAGRGLDVVLDLVTGAPDVTISNATVTNSGGRGVSVAGILATLGDISMTNVSSDTTTAEEGVAVDLILGSVGSITMNNVSANASTSTGILVDLLAETMTGLNPAISLDGQGTAFSTNNGGDGILVNLAAVTGTPDVTISNYNLIDNNAGRGIAFITDSDVGDVDVSGNTVSNSTGGQGILIDLTNNVVDSVTIDGNTISDSAGRGLDLILNGVTGLPNIVISDTTVTNSGGRGVSVGGVGSLANPMLLGTITMTNVSSDTTTAEDGVRIDLSADAVANGKVGDITQTNVSANNSFGGGVITTLTNMTLDPSITIDGQGTATANNNGGDGVRIQLTNVVGVPTDPDITISGYSSVDNNAGRGIVFLSDSDVRDVVVSDNTVSNTLGGQGILVDLSNLNVGSVTMDGNTISDSAGRGLDLDLDFVTGLPNIVISNTTVTNSGGRGVSVNGVGNALNPIQLGTIDLTNVSSDGTTAEDGVVVFISADNAANGKVGDVTLTNVSSNNSFGMGIVTLLNNVTLDPSVTLDGQGTATASDNGGRGILISLTNVVGAPGIPDVTVDGYDEIDENGGNGLTVLASSTPIGTLTISDNAIRGNEGHGVSLDLNNAPIDNLRIVRNNRGSNIGLGFFVDGSTFGLPFRIDNTSTSNIDIVGFTFDISTNTTFPQANFDTDSPPVVTASAALPFAPSGGTEVTTGLLTINGSTNPPAWEIPDESQVMTATFNDFNPGENFQWIVDLDQTPGGDEGYSGNQLIGSTVTVNFENGADLTGTMQAVLGFPQASQFVATSGLLGAGISNNHGDGIRISQNNSSIGNILIDDNEIDSNDGITGSGNPGHGINFAVVNNSDIGPTVVSNNIINDNTGDGFRLIDPNLVTPTLDLTFTDNDSISGNGGNGVNLEMNSGQAVTLAMTGNNIGVEGDGNLGMGVRAVFSGTSSLNATIGATEANANTFTGNGDAGFGLIMSDNTTGALTVENSSFNTSINGSDATFAGVGLGINLTGNASLTPITIGDALLDNTNFNGNASHGFSISTDGNSVAAPIVIQHVAANNSTGGDGLNFNHQGNSTLDNVTITESTMSGNAGDGIDITTAGSIGPSDYLITNNTITENDTVGVRLHVVADSDLVATITGNTISTNGAGGILSTEVADVTDTPTTRLLIQDNVINTNTGNGITIASTHEATINLNTISDNTLDGVNFSALARLVDLGLNGGTDEITNNIITDNGRDGISYAGTSIGSLFGPAHNLISGNTITGNVDDGIDLSSAYLGTDIVDNVAISGNGDDGIAITSSGILQEVTIDGNPIENNTGDGIQIGATNASGSSILGNNVFTITDNEITGNTRRGINVVNAGDADTVLTIGSTVNPALGNRIGQNGLEGTYIVNTASNTQANGTNINNAATTAMLADGSVFATPNLDLIVGNNDFNSNGSQAGTGGFIDASGFVLRVGTSDASTSFTDPGGTAATRSGVQANVSNNVFAGHFGADVTFNAFVSTANPATTSGSWTDQNESPRDNTDDLFTVNSFVSDPLARLDLTFSGNFGQGLLASNSANSTAFYENDESVFKSRTVAQDTATDIADGPGDDQGPYASGTRNRNATRLATRAGLPPSLTILGVSGSSDAFLFSGEGGSTFRIFGGAAAANAANFFADETNNFSSTINIGDEGEDFIWGSF